jgi:hypothetical protein
MTPDERLDEREREETLEEYITGKVHQIRADTLIRPTIDLTDDYISDILNGICRHRGCDWTEEAIGDGQVKGPCIHCGKEVT